MTEPYDIINSIDDLIKQVTTEESHYYTAKVLKECRSKIMALRIVPNEARKLIEQLEPCGECNLRGRMWISKCRDECGLLKKWLDVRDAARLL